MKQFQFNECAEARKRVKETTEGGGGEEGRKHNRKSTEQFQDCDIQHIANWIKTSNQWHKEEHNNNNHPT